jgi:imidazolonepropionase
MSAEQGHLRLLDGIGRLITGVGPPLRDAAVALDGQRIAWVGPARQGPPPELAARVGEREELGGALVTAGLVDAHTHPLYAGDRHAEIALRSTGATYTEIAAAGGGIGASVLATRAHPHDRLERETAARLRCWLVGGATTVEVKTGYHLDVEGELADVALLSRLRGRSELPDLAVTFLAAHAVPADHPGDADQYVEAAASWCAPAADAGADGVDVFCDQGYFTVEQARRILLAGRAAGLDLRIHADELAHSGGALLAAELGARSADHLLHVDERDAAALAAAGVVATLAPVTALGMGRMPPARMLRDSGVRLALASDHNPGTSGVMGMSLVVALAVSALGLSVDQALEAATRGGAAALGLDDRGTVEVGRRADLVAWDAEHEGAFAWAYGLQPRRVWRAGVPIEGPSP